MKSTIVTGRERSCTAFARERRWSETNFKSNEGVDESDGEDAEDEDEGCGVEDEISDSDSDSKNR